MRFEEAEAAILNELSLVATLEARLVACRRCACRATTMGAVSEAIAGSHQRDSRDNASKCWAHRIFRMLLHARAEFDLSYPHPKNSVHPRASARIAEQNAASSGHADELLGIGSEHRGGGDYYEEYSERIFLLE